MTNGKACGLGWTLALTLVAGAAIGAVGGAAGQPAGNAADTLRAAEAALVRAHPGAQVMRTAARVTGVYGTALQRGASPEAAADGFFATSGAVLGGSEGQELVLERSAPIRNGRFTALAYKQYIDGLPVEHGLVRVLVANDLADAAGRPGVGGEVGGVSDAVVYVGATLAQKPEGGFPADTFSAGAALAKVQGLFPGLPVWSTPEMVVFYGEGDFGTAHRAWKVTGEVPVLTMRQKQTFFISAATGEVLFVRNEVLHVDVAGTVRGYITPYGENNTNPDLASNPPVLALIDFLRVDITGGANAFTNGLGVFNISNPGTAAVALTTSLVNGQYGRIVDATGTAILSASQGGVVPPGNVLFTLNGTPSEYTTAQLNAFYHTHRIHEYFRSRSSFTPIDIQLPVNVNLNDTCNAFYDGASINFFRVGGGCVNSAYSSVVAHEYGHFIVNELGLGQGGFGEGFGDTCSMLLYDDAIIGRGFRQPANTPIRTPDTVNQQYPCSSTAVHTCGQILGGVFWEMRKNFGAAFNDAGNPAKPGLQYLRQLHVDWAQVTIGGTGSNFLNSANPQTAIELLTLDDTDANLNNGTPNYTLICPAFAAHNISCPVIPAVAFVYPNGIPTEAAAGSTVAVRVDVVGNTGTPTPGTGRVSYRLNPADAYTTVFMTVVGTNQYVANLPGPSCGGNLEYYFSSSANSGTTTVRDPVDAPTTVYRTRGGVSGTPVLADTFTNNLGWVVGGAGDTAISGQWVRGDPVGTIAQPENDSPDAGSNCYFTGQGVVGGADGAADVDGGVTTLTSPTVNLAGQAAAEISYWRWYDNSRGAAPGADVFEVQISSDNGATWSALETVGPSGTGTTGGWIAKSFTLTSGLTGQVKIRFRASDLGTGSLVEAAVDDVKFVPVICAAACPADFTGDGFVDDLDFVIFAAAYDQFSVPPANSDCDLTGDGFVDDLDFVIFAAAYDEFACP